MSVSHAARDVRLLQPAIKLLGREKIIVTGKCMVLPPEQTFTDFRLTALWRSSFVLRDRISETEIFVKGHLLRQVLNAEVWFRFAFRCDAYPG
jgi:hypothetical protein